MAAVDVIEGSREDVVRLKKGCIALLGEVFERMGNPLAEAITETHRRAIRIFCDAIPKEEDRAFLRVLEDMDPVCIDKEDPKEIFRLLHTKADPDFGEVGPNRHVYNPAITVNGTPLSLPIEELTHEALAQLIDPAPTPHAEFLAVELTATAVPLEQGRVIENAAPAQVRFHIRKAYFEGEGTWGGFWVQSFLYKTWYRLQNGNPQGLTPIAETEVKDGAFSADFSHWKKVLVAQAAESTLESELEDVSVEVMTATTTLLKMLATRYCKTGSRPESYQFTQQQTSALNAAFRPEALMYANPHLVNPSVWERFKGTPTSRPHPYIGGVIYTVNGATCTPRAYKEMSLGGTQFVQRGIALLWFDEDGEERFIAFMVTSTNLMPASGGKDREWAINKSPKSKFTASHYLTTLEKDSMYERVDDDDDAPKKPPLTEAQLEAKDAAKKARLQQLIGKAKRVEMSDSSSSTSSDPFEQQTQVVKPGKRQPNQKPKQQRAKKRQDSSTSSSSYSSSSSSDESKPPKKKIRTTSPPRPTTPIEVIDISSEEEAAKGEGEEQEVLSGDESDLSVDVGAANSCPVDSLERFALYTKAMLRRMPKAVRKNTEGDHRYDLEIPEGVMSLLAAKTVQKYGSEVKEMLQFGKTQKRAFRIGRFGGADGAVSICLQHFFENMPNLLEQPLINDVFVWEDCPEKRRFIASQENPPAAIFHSSSEAGASQAHTTRGLQEIPSDIDILSVNRSFVQTTVSRSVLDYITRHTPSTVIIDCGEECAVPAVLHGVRNIEGYSGEALSFDTLVYYAPQGRMVHIVVACLQASEGQMGKICDIVRGLQLRAENPLCEVSRYLLPTSSPQLWKIREKGEGVTPQHTNSGHYFASRHTASWGWREYLAGLSSDAKARIERAYTTHAGADPSEDLFTKLRFIATEGDVDSLAAEANPVVTNHGRPLTGAEHIGFLGLSAEGLCVDGFGEAFLHGIAVSGLYGPGGAVVAVAALLASNVDDFSMVDILSTKEPHNKVSNITQIEETKIIPKEGLLEAAMYAHSTRRVCSCEAPNQLFTSYYRCVDCEMTMCEECEKASKPSHSLRHETRPAVVVNSELLLSRVPKEVAFGIAESEDPYQQRVATFLRNRVLHLKDLRRDPNWVAEYAHPCGDVRAALCFAEQMYEWRVYARREMGPDATEESREWVPLVIVDGIGTVTLAAKAVTVPLRMETTTPTRSWAGEVTQSNSLTPSTVTIEPSDNATVCSMTAGTFLRLPNCGGPCGMLYKRQREEGRSLFLFLDAQPEGAPQQDRMVVSSEYGRRAEHPAKFPEGWRISPTTGTEDVNIELAAFSVVSGGVTTDSGDYFTGSKPWCEPSIPDKCTIPTVASRVCAPTTRLAKSMLSTYTLRKQWVQPENEAQSICTTCYQPSTAAHKSCALYTTTNVRVAVREGRAVMEKEVCLVINPIALIHRVKGELMEAAGSASGLRRTGPVRSMWCINRSVAPSPEPPAVLLTQGCSPDHSYDNVCTQFNEYQTRLFSWVAKQEVHGQQWCNERDAEASLHNVTIGVTVQQSVLLRGGVLLDDINFGKRSILMHLISLNLAHEPSALDPDILQGMTTATLIISNSLDQWQTLASQSKTPTLTPSPEELTTLSADQILNTVVLITEETFLHSVPPLQKLHWRRAILELPPGASEVRRLTESFGEIDGFAKWLIHPNAVFPSPEALWRHAASLGAYLFNQNSSTSFSASRRQYRAQEFLNSFARSHLPNPGLQVQRKTITHSLDGLGRMHYSEVDSGDVGALQIAAAGVACGEAMEGGRIVHCAKYLRDVSAAGERVIVFGVYKVLLAVLSSQLKALGVDCIDLYTVTGSALSQAVLRTHAPSSVTLAEASLSSQALSLDLSHISHLVHLHPYPGLPHLRKRLKGIASNRIIRTTQTQPVTEATFLTEDTIDGTLCEEE